MHVESRMMRMMLVAIEIYVVVLIGHTYIHTSWCRSGGLCLWQDAH